MTQVTTTMDKKAYYRAYLQVYLKTFLRALLAVGLLVVLVAIEFGVDFAVNGADKSWEVTGSLMWLVMVAGIAVLAYGALLPLTALSFSSAAVKKSPALTDEIAWRYDAKTLSVKTSDSEKKAYEWTDLRLYKDAKEYLILRDKSKQYLFLSKEQWTAEQIAELLALKKAADDKNFYENNPVSAEQARKEQENATGHGEQDTEPAPQKDEGNGEKEEGQKD